MISTASTLFESANRLHAYMVDRHLNGRAIEGPDSGVRINFRIGRFIKSYLDSVPWSDRYIYMQAQGYWILGNWLLADIAQRTACEEQAVRCSEYVLEQQRPAGFWEYPNPEWKGRVATVEGNFAALGLLETYARTGKEKFLRGAQAWHRYLIDEIGFQDSGAINYFANRPGGAVPNNTALTLRVMARFAEATGDQTYLAQAAAMVSWLSDAQRDTGELPYRLDSSSQSSRPHFLCFQYNAFEFLDLAEYFRLTGDTVIEPVLTRLARFLSTGVRSSGAAKHSCLHDSPETTYYTAAVARALSVAGALGFGPSESLSERAYRRLLSLQRPDGNMRFFSSGNYGRLTDRRSYPRNLAMILFHMLSEL